ncbi:MAG: protein-disulfide reductase DsbD [Steroidobacteraceae bacterium]
MPRPIGHMLAATLLVATVLAQAQSPAAGPASPLTKPTGINAVLSAAKSDEDKFLPPDQAFRFDALGDGSDRVRLHWDIADGYYLYRARIKVSAPSTQAQLGPPQFPTGQFKTDEYFGRQEIYHHDLAVTVPVARAGAGRLELPVQVTYQGCAEAGLCYPPITRTVSVTLDGGGGSPGASSGRAFPGGGGSVQASGGGADQDWFAALVRGNPLLMLAGFYVAGLLLACTPCVLPMVPILSGLIVSGGRTLTPARGFALSASYVLGMAVTYAVAGVACAAAGQQVQAIFQQWWVLTLFAAVFVVLALSMFGVFTVQMPAAVQTRIAALSNRQSAGTFGGVAVMGALSALIVTTCVGPALVGALLVISQTGQMVRGGAALFIMAVGMGTPLLVVGASAGKLLPKAGPWMDFVKRLFGVMMLAVAAWMLARIVPGRLMLLLWAVPALALAWLLWREAASRAAATWVLRTAGLAAALYGVALAAGAALGGSDPLAPIPLSAQRTRELQFQPIHSVADLEHAVADARAHGRGVLVDFSAAWCTSCKEMDRYTFTDPAVQAALSGTTLLRADVTDNTADDQALLKHFGIFGPPTIAFYSPDGQERTQYRVVGYMKAEAFAKRSQEALRPPL